MADITDNQAPPQSTLKVSTSADNLADSSSQSQLSTPSSNPRSPMKLCFYFAQGNCRNGNECRFSHDQNLLNSQPRPPHRYQNNAGNHSPIPNMVPPPMAPPPLFVQIPPEQPVYCIDVECVATGVQHNSRAVAQVAMVDQWNRLVYNAYIKQDVPVVSYLTELHGITKEIIEEKGIPLGMSLLLLSVLSSPST